MREYRKIVKGCVIMNYLEGYYLGGEKGGGGFLVPLTNTVYIAISQLIKKSEEELKRKKRGERKKEEPRAIIIQHTKDICGVNVPHCLLSLQRIRKCTYVLLSLTPFTNS